ncbi:hypothetical protein BT69DRAFT_1283140 [Atractiella rhizophila]|nr:hypothetical protein BT69DRAFT_1283140 [Atractiella rhizophila]
MASSDVPLGVSGFELEIPMELVLVRGAWRLASEDGTGTDGLHAGLRVPPSLPSLNPVSRCPKPRPNLGTP